MTVKRPNVDEIQGGAATASALPDAVKSSCTSTENKTKKRRTLSSGSSVSSMDSTEEKDNLMLARPVKKAGKKQMRYEPDVPMSKEEASAWRRKQRRLRNRESAAASRQKTRDRISELEDELDVWKSRFEALENQIKVSGQTPCVKAPVEEDFVNHFNNSVNCPAPLMHANQELAAGVVSPPPSPVLSSTKIVALEPVNSSAVALVQKEPQVVVKVDDKANTKQHITETISRPAVKITGAASKMPTPSALPTPAPFCYPIMYPATVVSSDSSATDDSMTEEIDFDMKPNLALPVLTGPSLLDTEFIDELLFDALSSL